MTAEVVVCVFAKPPRAGEVNTRLAPAVGLDGAARLARAFVLDTVAAVDALPWARLVLASPSPWPDSIPLPPGTDVWPQGDGDLGVRLERVLRRALELAPAALALGIDSPGMPSTLLEDARRALQTHGAVLGPCDDGGFYTLGLTTCPEGLLAELPWSTIHTFARTRVRIEGHGLDLSILAPWFDVDLPADLDRLRAHLADGRIHARETARALELLDTGRAE